MRSFLNDGDSIRISVFLVIPMLLIATGSWIPAAAQETPYFVTYSHHLEEPGNLEIESNSIFGTQRAGNQFVASATEFEYGVRAWWTTEFYLDGQSTFGDSTLFTGFRWENRFRPLMHEHWINPVLYFEFEDINGADKTLLEVVDHDSEADTADSNAAARLDRKRELETKLILSSDFKGWNVLENFISEKNLAAAPWEFGYAVGASRPLRPGRNPAALRFLSREFSGGRRVLWRPGKHGEPDAIRHIALRRGHPRLADAKRHDIPFIARLGTQWREPQIPASLGNFL